MFDRVSTKLSNLGKRWLNKIKVTIQANPVEVSKSYLVIRNDCSPFQCVDRNVLSVCGVASGRISDCGLHIASNSALWLTLCPHASHVRISQRPCSL